MSPPTVAQAKKERLEARVPSEIKSLAEHAATLSGISLTDLIIQSIKTYSEGIIEREKIIRLTAQDSMIFADVVLNRTEPNEALRDAAQRYRDLFGDLP
ncbi:MAG: DUF1778 domain-containing protein [Thermomicrobiales bacterium]|nr:DUF1778 domain-containing protein [Thermomicrobiales bacterium]